MFLLQSTVGPTGVLGINSPGSGIDWTPSERGLIPGGNARTAETNYTGKIKPNKFKRFLFGRCLISFTPHSGRSLFSGCIIYSADIASKSEFLNTFKYDFTTKI